MRKIVQVIESISEWGGRIVSWLCLALVLVLFYEVVMRYVFDSPTIWVHLTSMMLGLALITGGLAYTHRYHAHVRVDVFYSLLSPRGKALADAVLNILVFFPFVITIIYSSGVRMCSAWSVNEVMTQTYWYPPAAPARTVFFLGFCLFAFQGVAQFIRDIHFVKVNKPL